MLTWLRSMFRKPEAPTNGAPFDLSTATLDQVLAEAERQQRVADDLREYRKALQRRAAELRGDR